MRGSNFIRTHHVRTTWVNREVSIPNGIPHLSVPSALVYGISKTHGRFFDAGPGTRHNNG
jgi:hypothetical protein